MPFRAINCLFSIQLHQFYRPRSVVHRNRRTHTNTYEPSNWQPMELPVATLNLHISTPCCITLSSWITTSSELNQMYLAADDLVLVYACITMDGSCYWCYCCCCYFRRSRHHRHCDHFRFKICSIFAFAECISCRSFTLYSSAIQWVWKGAVRTQRMCICIRLLQNDEHWICGAGACPCLPYDRAATHTHTYEDEMKLFVFYAKWVQIQFNYI